MSVKHEVNADTVQPADFKTSCVSCVAAEYNMYISGHSSWCQACRPFCRSVYHQPGVNENVLSLSPSLSLSHSFPHFRLIPSFFFSPLFQALPGIFQKAAMPTTPNTWPRDGTDLLSFFSGECCAVRCFVALGVMI